MTNKSQQSKSVLDWRARWLVENYGLFVSPGKWTLATFKVTVKKKPTILLLTIEMALKCLKIAAHGSH